MIIRMIRLSLVHAQKPGKYTAHHCHYELTHWEDFEQLALLSGPQFPHMYKDICELLSALTVEGNYRHRMVTPRGDFK